VDRAIRALPEVVRAFPNTILLVVGDGRERQRLERLAMSLGISEHIRFEGAVPHKDVSKYLAAADVFLSLYDLSNVGNPLLEAMMAGKCIVTLNNGDTGRFIRNGENGILLEYEDLPKLPEVIKDLLANEDLRNRLGTNARKFAEEHFWSWQERTEAEIAEVNRLIEQRKKRIMATNSRVLFQFLHIPVFWIEKLCCYLVFITGFFGVALFPIDLGPFTLFPYRIFLILLWGLFVARILIQGKAVLPVSRVKPYIAFLGLWVAYAVTSLGWAAAKGDAIRHLIFLFMGVSLIFFASYYFRSYRDLQRLYWIWLGIFCGMVVLGFWEHLTGQHLPVSGYFGETRARFMYCPTGVFYNPNDYATFLALSIPFALGVLRYAKRWLPRLIGLGTALAAFYLTVITGSRTNILAVLLELVFIVVLLTDIRQKVKVAIAAIVYVVIALFLLPSPIQELAAKITRELSSIATKAELSIGSVAIRMNLALNGLAFLYSTAGFGVGAGNAEYWMANYARYDTAGILNLHNWWLEILVNYGLFIFVGYVMFYASLVWQLWRIWRTTDRGRNRMIVEALLVALIGFLVASISSSSIMALTPQWLLFAFALAFLNWWRCSKPRSAP